MAHFLLNSKILNASRVATIFIEGIIKLNGLNMTIVSDMDVKFINYFRKTIWHNLGTKLKFSIAFHSHTDGRAKVVNKSLAKLLATLISEHIES